MRGDLTESAKSWHRILTEVVREPTSAYDAVVTQIKTPYGTVLHGTRSKEGGSGFPLSCVAPWRVPSLVVNLHILNMDRCE